MIFYGPAQKLERLDLSLEGCHKLFEARQALIDTLPPKEQELVDYQDRYATWLDAERGHEAAVTLVEDTTGIERATQPGGILP